MEIIYHLIQAASWEKAQSLGQVIPDSLANEGFIHCSRTEEQALAVAKRLYTGLQDMLVLGLDTDRLESPLKHELSQSGEIYPHIYGPLPVRAVIMVRPLEIDSGGDFHLP